MPFRARRGLTRRKTLARLAGGFAGSLLLALAGCIPAPAASPAPEPTPTPAPATPIIAEPTDLPSPVPPTSTPPAPAAAATSTPPSATATPPPLPTATAPSASPTLPPSPQASPALRASPSPGATRSLRLATNHAAVEIPWFRKVLDAFGRESSELRVEHINVASRYLEQVASWAGEGKLPDVLFTRSSSSAAWAFKRWIASIDDLVARDGQAIDLADFHPLQVSQLKLAGKWLLLPYDFTVPALFSRVDAFADSGGSPGDDWSWADIAAAAKRATKRDSSGVSRWGFSWRPDAGAMAGLWLAEAGGILLESGRGIAITSAEHIRVAQWLADLALVDGVAPRPGEADSATLAGGKLAAEVSPSWAAASYRSAGAKVNATTLPKGTSCCRAGCASGSGWAIAQSTKERDGAWKLLRHLSSRDSLEILVALPLRDIPGRVSAVALWQSGLEALGSPDRPGAIVRMAAESNALPLLVWWLDYQDVYGELMPKVWSGEKKAAEVLPELEKRVNAAAARYYA